MHVRLEENSKSPLDFYRFFLYYLLNSIINPFRLGEIIVLGSLKWFFTWPCFFIQFIDSSDVLESPVVLQKVNYFGNVQFFNKLGTRLMIRGLKMSKIIIENFYIFVKQKYRIDPWHVVYGLFNTAYDLPFNVNSITRSGRTYYFPDPFLNDIITYKFFLKKFGFAIRKRPESFLLGRIFGELIDFLSGRSSSSLKSLLESIFLQGLENRAYIHYRWYTKKK